MCIINRQSGPVKTDRQSPVGIDRWRMEKSELKEIVRCE